jgi:hypothetical protein
MFLTKFYDNQIQKDELRGHVECMVEKGNAYGFLVRKFEGKGPLRRPGHKWEDTIKMRLTILGSASGLSSLRVKRFIRKRQKLLATVSMGGHLL